MPARGKHDWAFGDFVCEADQWKAELRSIVMGDVIDQIPQDGLTPTVENWRQLPDGQIEFAIRYFSTAD
jgi:hypothetical protein